MSAAARRSIEDQDLEAFADDMLPPEAASKVSIELEKNDIALAKVTAYRRQRLSLRLLYEHVMRQRVPERMRRMIEEARAKARRRRDSDPQDPSQDH